MRHLVIILFVLFLPIFSLGRPMMTSPMEPLSRKDEMRQFGYQESLEDQLKGSASFWLELLRDVALYNDDPAKLMRNALAADVTPAALKSAAKTFLAPERAINVTVHPLKK